MTRRPLAAAAVLLAAAPLALGGVAVFGGPTFDAATGDGFRSGSARASEAAGAGFAYRVVDNNNDLGTRPFRFGPGGVTELGVLGTGSNASNLTFVNDANPAGTVVGSVEKYVGGVHLGRRATRWDANSTVAVELGGLGVSPVGGASGSANAVNASGAVAGYAEKWLPNGQYLGVRPVRWAAGSTVATELGVLSTRADGAALTYAQDVNAAGTVVGWGNQYNGNANAGVRPIRWDAGSTAPTELLGPGGFPIPGFAFVVNDAGTTVGTTSPGNGQRALRWAGGSNVAVELGGLGTPGFGGQGGNTFVRAINAAGDAVGFAPKHDAGTGVYRGQRPVRWDGDGTAATELLGLGTSSLGVANGIDADVNDSGIVVGRVDQYAGGVYAGTRAVAWGTAGSDGVTPLELTALLPAGSAWTLLRAAESVTDAGWVTGTGDYDPDGPGGAGAYERLFLMLVPSAGTYGLGDADFDGDVNFADLARLAANYGQPSGGSTAVADLDLDGDVDFADLATLAANYGGPADASAFGAAFARDFALARVGVPEPAAALALAAPALLGFRTVRFGGRRSESVR